MSGPASWHHARLLPDPLVAKKEKEQAVQRALEARKLEMNAVAKQKPRGQHHAAAKIDSPRSRYSDMLDARIQAQIGVLMRLSIEAIDGIRQEFMQAPGHALDVMDFVDTVGRHINGTSDFKVENDADALVEIFKTVDLNGDKVMSWHEFTSFLAELVSQLSSSGVDSLLHFLPSRFEDETFHFRPVEYVKYLPGMDKVLVAERSVDFFKIYSKELRLIKECRGHTGGILCALQLPEFDLLVTSASDQTLRFWKTNPTSADYLQTVQCWKLASPQICMAWADFVLYTANSKSQIIMWDVEKREVRHTFIGHSGIVMDMIVLPVLRTNPENWPRRALVSCSVDATIRVWDPQNRKELRVFRGHEKEVMCVAYSEYAELLISGGADDVLLVWALDCSQPLQQIRVQNPESMIISLTTIPGTPELITCDAKGAFCVYDLRDLSLVQCFHRSVQIHHSINSVSCILDQRVLFACSAEHGVIRFDKVQPLHLDKAFQMAALDQQLALARAKTMANTRGSIGRLTSTSNYKVELETMQDERVQAAVAKKQRQSRLLAKSVAGQNVSAEDYEEPEVISKAEAKRRKLKEQLNDDRRMPIVWAEYNPVTLSIVAAIGTHVTVWDALTGKVRYAFRDMMPAPISSATLDSRSRRLFLGDNLGHIKCFDLSNGASMRDFQSHSSEVSVLEYFAPRSEVLSASWDSDVRFHEDITQSDDLPPFRHGKKHSRDVTAIAHTAAFDLFATGSLDCTVLVYEPLCLSVTVLNFLGGINSLAFLGDLPFLVAADSVGEITLFRTLSLTDCACVLQFFNCNEASSSADRAELVSPKRGLGRGLTIDVDTEKWDPTPSSLNRFPPPTDWVAVTSLHFDPDALMLYTGDEQGFIKAWDMTAAFAHVGKAIVYEKPPAALASPDSLFRSNRFSLSAEVKTRPVTGTTSAFSPKMTPTHFPSNGSDMAAEAPIFSSTPASEPPALLPPSSRVKMPSASSGESLFSHSSVSVSARGRDPATVSAPPAPLDCGDFSKQGLRVHPALADIALESARSHADIDVFQSTHRDDVHSVLHESNDNDAVDRETLHESVVDAVSNVVESTMLPKVRDVMLPNFQPKPVLCWQAHKNRVVGIKIISDSENPRVIMSWGFDGGVHLWSLHDGSYMTSMSGTSNIGDSHIKSVRPPEAPTSPVNTELPTGLPIDSPAAPNAVTRTTTAPAEPLDDKKTSPQIASSPHSSWPVHIDPSRHQLRNSSEIDRVNEILAERKQSSTYALTFRQPSPVNTHAPASFSNAGIESSARDPALAEISGADDILSAIYRHQRKLYDESFARSLQDPNSAAAGDGKASSGTSMFEPPSITGLLHSASATTIALSSLSAKLELPALPIAALSAASKSSLSPSPGALLAKAQAKAYGEAQWSSTTALSRSLSSMSLTMRSPSHSTSLISAADESNGSESRRVEKLSFAASLPLLNSPASTAPRHALAGSHSESVLRASNASSPLHRKEWGAGNVSNKGVFYRTHPEAVLASSHGAEVIASSTDDPLVELPLTELQRTALGRLNQALVRLASSPADASRGDSSPAGLPIPSYVRPTFGRLSSLRPVPGLPVPPALSPNQRAPRRPYNAVGALSSPVHELDIAPPPIDWQQVCQPASSSKSGVGAKLLRRASSLVSLKSPERDSGLLLVSPSARLRALHDLRSAASVPVDVSESPAAAKDGAESDANDGMSDDGGDRNESRRVDESVDEAQHGDDQGAESALRIPTAETVAAPLVEIVQPPLPPTPRAVLAAASVLTRSFALRNSGAPSALSASMSLRSPQSQSHWRSPNVNNSVSPGAQWGAADARQLEVDEARRRFRDGILPASTVSKRTSTGRVDVEALQRMLEEVV